MSEPSTVEIIIARSRYAYRKYLSAHGKDARVSMYVHDPSQLDGLHDLPVVVVDQPWNNAVMCSPRIVKKGNGYVLV